MRKLKFLFSLTFLKHLFLALLFIILLIFGTLQVLKFYTHHGDSLVVPSFIGSKGDEIAKIAKENHLRYKIIDSVHVDFAEQGAVVEQVPKVDAKVKQGRKILLTINSVSPETVVIPKLTDISFRQAKGLIENSGLKIGTISFEESEFNNLILEVSSNGEILAEGDKINKTDLVDIKVGKYGNMTVRLPILYGKTLSEAEKDITSAMLNKGQIVFDSDIVSNQDKAKARIWKQSTPNSLDSIVDVGTEVSIWLTLDDKKITDAMNKIKTNTENKDSLDE